MGFSNLRVSSPLYILNREGVPAISIGSIVSVTAPYAKYGMQMAFGQQSEQVVDLTVKVDDKQGQFFKVPAGADSWEYENNGVKTQYILATGRDAINAEIGNLRQQAVSVISSVEHNRQVVAACDEMLRQLNPEVAEKQRQDAEIADLRKQLTIQQGQMAELIALLKGGGEKVSKDERPSKNK